MESAGDGFLTTDVLGARPVRAAGFFGACRAAGRAALRLGPLAGFFTMDTRRMAAGDLTGRVEDFFAAGRAAARRRRETARRAAEAALAFTALTTEESLEDFRAMPDDLPSPYYTARRVASASPCGIARRAKRETAG